MTLSNRVPDPFHGLSLERVYSGSRPPLVNQIFQVDVCVVGSGPAGCVAAAVAAQAGKSVLIIESGAFLRAQEFSQEESVASILYQEGMTQRSQGGELSILQGRAVGGSSTVNWTSCFRPPAQTLSFWQDQYGLKGFGLEDLGRYFSDVEEKLNVTLWDSPNANNEKIQQGCKKLGWHWGAMHRNVKGCWNIGYCGQGCPTNAKQSALTTYLVDALSHGAFLWSDADVAKLEHDGSKILSAWVRMSNQDFKVKADDFVICAGAIGSPGLLFRSRLGIDAKLKRARTFLHPAVTSFAKFEDEILPFTGAPQSIYSDEFLWPGPDFLYPGFKIEAMPLLPMFAGGLSVFLGQQHRAWIGQLPQVQGVFAMQRDGFDWKAPGSTLHFDQERRPRVEFRPPNEQMEGFRFALLRLAEIQFAAGAREVLPLHALAKPVSDFESAQKMLAELPFEEHFLRIGSAHVMGGCPLSPDPEIGIVNESGLVHGFKNCYVFDGSIFPTSLGANPQIAIFSIALKLSKEKFA